MGLKRRKGLNRNGWRGWVVRERVEKGRERSEGELEGNGEEKNRD